MSIEITADGQTIGHADSIVKKMEPDYIGSGAYPPYRVDSIRRIDLKGFNTFWGGIDYKRLYFRELEDHNNLLGRYAELQAGHDHRGKTIEELTETFKAKKERIHEFYAPQLENRKRELKELEDMSEFARNETLSANDWYLKADDLEEELKLERARRSNQRDTILRYQVATGTASPQEVTQQTDKPVVEQGVHDSVIQEYEEQISILARKADNLEESYETAKTHRLEGALKNYDLSIKKSELEKRNAYLEDQLKQVNDAVDQTVDLFNKTGTALNRASDAGDTE